MSNKDLSLPQRLSEQQIEHISSILGLTTPQAGIKWLKEKGVTLLIPPGEALLVFTTEDGQTFHSNDVRKGVITLAYLAGIVEITEKTVLDYKVNK